MFAFDRARGPLHLVLLPEVQKQCENTEGRSHIFNHTEMSISLEGFYISFLMMLFTAIKA